MVNGRWSIARSSSLVSRRKAPEVAWGDDLARRHAIAADRDRGVAESCAVEPTDTRAEERGPAHRVADGALHDPLVAEGGAPGRAVRCERAMRDRGGTAEQRVQCRGEETRPHQRGPDPLAGERIEEIRGVAHQGHAVGGDAAT